MDDDMTAEIEETQAKIKADFDRIEAMLAGADPEKLKETLSESRRRRAILEETLLPLLDSMQDLVDSLGTDNEASCEEFDKMADQLMESHDQAVAMGYGRGFVTPSGTAAAAG